MRKTRNSRQAQACQIDLVTVEPEPRRLRRTRLWRERQAMHPRLRLCGRFDVQGECSLDPYVLTLVKTWASTLRQGHHGPVCAVGAP